MKRVRLSKEEKEIEARMDAYVPVKGSEYQAIAQAVAARRKDAVLNIRINRQDLENIKLKARKLGVKYQSFVAEILHKVAQL
ncbi:antitoxin [bacterium]|nr:antitoxin [bacterium]